ncbi:MAG: exo-alpha-sialidase [Clostridia bacterium]|nr:exo-alpha-sialidase [Clostridia bacterium]
MYMNDKLLFASGGRSNYRIPSIVATNNGTVLAFCNDRKDSLSDHAEEVALVCARKKPGQNWGEVETLVGIPGWSCAIGSAVYDAVTDTVMCSGGRTPVTKNEFGKYSKEELAAMEKAAEERAAAQGIRRGALMLYSSDSGETWVERPLKVEKYTYTKEDGTTVDIGGSCHGAAHGIQLRHGAYAGRLLCPSRDKIRDYDRMDELCISCVNNAIYSDDHGMTWKASAPVQVGTGEGTLIENADGTITYNSRAYFKDQKRYLAASTDGGASWGNFRTDDFLIEEKAIGCNASFLRVEREELTDASLLPEGADSVTIFVNPRAETRRNLTACVSFDSGKTWSHTKTIREGQSSYSSLVFSAADQHFYLLYEMGEKNPYEAGIAIREFDLEWLLGE